MTDNIHLDHISSKEAIQNIIRYSDQHNHLLDRFNTHFYTAYFDHDTIQDLHQKMGSSTYNQAEFVRELACFILHGPDQTLFLVISLIDIFKQIVDGKMGKEMRVGFKDFTGFICEGIANRQEEISICSKEIAIEKMRPDAKLVRDIDVYAASVVVRVEREPTKISQSIKKKEKKIDEGKPLHIFEVNHQKKEIITLGRLASHISIFDQKLKKLREITPACCKKYDNSVAISSMSFSESQQRIGCIINHVGLVFWEYQDNFNTQKIIPKLIGNKIYYLPLLDQWITTTHNTIYFWDLKLQTIKFMHEESQAIALHDMEQITHLRCLAVSYTLKDQYKWLYVYRNDGLKAGSKVKLAIAGAQKIHYHRRTQTLLLLGSKSLPVYQIDTLSLDPTLVKELEGHETIITAVADLMDGTIVTGDDRGNLRIWDLNALRCYQTFRIASFITRLACLNYSLFFSDSRLNQLQLEQLAPKIPIDEQFGIKKFYRFEGTSAELIIFTKISVRIYNLLDGRIQKVIELCNSQEEIITAEQFRSDFLVSTSKSFLYCYSRDFKVKWKFNPKKHRSQYILQIQPDFRNHFFATLSKEGNIHVWNQKTIFDQGPRKSIMNNDKTGSYQIAIFDLSQKYNLIVSAQKVPNVKLWDYQSCKLCNLVELPANPLAVKIADEKPLLAVGCADDKIYLYKVSRKETCFNVIFLQYAHLIYPQVSLNSLLSVQEISYQMPTPKRQQFRTPLQEISFCLQFPRSIMAVCYGRGKLITFNTNEVVNKNFRDSTFFKPAINVQRPVIQHIQKQVTKNQYKRTEKIDEDVLSIYQKLKVIWNKKIHGDCITHIDVCQNRYFGTLSLDGYVKFVALDGGDVIASLSIRHPLPILWKLQISIQELLLKKVHTALTLISEIVKDKSNSSYTLEQLNLQPFMELICFKKKGLPFRKRKKSVRLLKQELKQQDFKGIRSHQQSLKSMQAFRRVSLIKQDGRSEQNNEYQLLRKYNHQQQEKDSMLKMLSRLNCKKRFSVKIDEQEQKIFTQVMEKYKASSHHVSPQKESKLLPEFTSSRRSLISKQKQSKQKSKSKYLGRSLSQSIKNLYDGGIPLMPHQKQDIYNKKLLDQLKRKEPLVSISNFLKNLDSKIPKQNQIKKHLKKNSCFAVKP